MRDHELSRREFVQRTAYLAGLAGAASLPISQLMQEAARAQALPLPNPRDEQLKHIVVLMMENRSFDHYFGWLSPVANASQHQTYTHPETMATQSTIHHSQLSGADQGYQGCGHPDPGHGWGSGREQLQNGFLDGGNDEFALTYWNEGELKFIHEAAKQYTVYDNFFCSVLGPTWPNRYYKWSAQSGGRKNNSPPIDTLGNQWETLFDRAMKTSSAPGRLVVPETADVKARYYNSDLPFSAVWGPRAVPWTRPIVEYYAECALGTLPNIAFVDPPFRDGGGFDGNSADEHPHGDVRLGQAFMADVVNAFVASPCYENGALFIVYDEWGGFFDHVTPPSVPDARANPADLENDFGQMGFRVPAVCVSPFTRRKPGDGIARVNSGQYGFESIVKLATSNFGLGDLTLRDQAANNIGQSFDFANPDLDRPDLPDPVYVASKPCALGGGNLLPEDAQAHQSDLADLEMLADRFGFQVGAGKPSDLFRAPDSVKKAVLQSS